MAPSAVLTEVSDQNRPETPTKGGGTTASPIDYFDNKKVTNDELVRSLTKAGGCIVRGMVSFEDLKQIENDVRPLLDADKPWAGSYFPPETRRAGGLACKSPTFLKVIIQNPLYQAVCTELLTSRVKNWLGDEAFENISAPQMNSAFAISIGPGAAPQGLHRDDGNYHNQLPAIVEEDYRVGRDTSIVLFVAGSKVTRENGTTRFVPGSHLKGSHEAPDESKVVYAEMHAGDGFIMLASTHHGGSANTTKDEERLMYGTCMVKGFLRQEENQYLALPLEKVKEFSKETQRLLGYGVSDPWTGWVDFKDPVEHLLSDGGLEEKAIW